MAITSLSVQQIVAVIQQQLAAPVGKGDKPPTPSLVAPQDAPRTARKENNPKATKRERRGLARLIGQRVAALQETDPDRGRKAFRIFLESLLLNELGENLINDAAFYQMVDEVQHQIENNRDTAKLMHEAIAQLLAGASPVLPR
jgi:hypothetical protein